MPERLTTPLKDGPLAGLAADIPALREKYYELRGLDDNGILKSVILEKCEIPKPLVNSLNELG